MLGSRRVTHVDSSSISDAVFFLLYVGRVSVEWRPQTLSVCAGQGSKHYGDLGSLWTASMLANLTQVFRTACLWAASLSKLRIRPWNGSVEPLHALFHCQFLPACIMNFPLPFILAFIEKNHRSASYEVLFLKHAPPKTHKKKPTIYSMQPFLDANCWFQGICWCKVSYAKDVGSNNSDA